MLADLNAMLDADARGEDTDEQFDEFMDKHGDFFPENPQNLDELIDALARRAAAAAADDGSLTAEQREELGRADGPGAGRRRPGRGDGAAGDNLRVAPPGPGLGRPRADATGDEPLGVRRRHRRRWQELADLDELDRPLGQDYPGAVARRRRRGGGPPRRSGRQAVDDLERLRELERELERQGYLHAHATAGSS